jgi:hypothetical protein
MDNELYLNGIKHNYDSLQSFYIKNNVLIFKDKETYYLPLRFVNLYKLNTRIFLLKPRDIYRVIFLLELIFKKELTDNDKRFINAYVERYLKYEENRLANGEENEIDIVSLGIPINLAYDPLFINNPTSQIIQSIINIHDNNRENGRSNNPKLVLTNPQFAPIVEKNPVEEIESYAKAGFTTFLLIGGTIIATCLYLAYFFLK